MHRFEVIVIFLWHVHITTYIIFVRVHENFLTNIELLIREKKKKEEKRTSIYCITIKSTSFFIYIFAYFLCKLVYMNIFLPHNYFISRSLELLILDEYKIDKTNFVLLMYKNLYSYFSSIL